MKVLLLDSMGKQTENETATGPYKSLWVWAFLRTCGFLLGGPRTKYNILNDKGDLVFRKRLCRDCVGIFSGLCKREMGAFPELGIPFWGPPYKGL